jgi:hypothetical protein
MRPDLLRGFPRQLDIILPREIDDRLEPHASVEVPMEINERKSRINQRLVRHPESASDLVA